MIRGLLFDLDGVLVNTTPLHARAWQELAEELGIPFTPADQEAFLGISRAQCLEILLKKGNRSLSESEKERLCTRKNDRYRELIGTLTPAALLPGDCFVFRIPYLVRKNIRVKRIVMTQVPALISLILPVKILINT